MIRTLRVSTATIAIAGLIAIPMTVGIDFAIGSAAHAQRADPGSNGHGGENRGGGKDARDSGASGAHGGPPEDRGEGRSANRNEDGHHGRGAMASALGAANAAHANQTGLENASRNSMPGKLYAYQQTGGITADGINKIDELENNLAALRSLPEDDPEAYLEAYDTNDDGTVSDEEIGDFEADIAELRGEITNYEESYAALAAIGDGRLNLTDDELDELNRLLGLDPGADSDIDG